MTPDSSAIINNETVVESSTTVNFSGIFTDNYDIASVTATITTPTQNTTETVNYPDVPEENVVFEYQFSDTAEKGDYTLQFTLTDGSGNSVTSQAFTFNVRHAVELQITSIDILPVEGQSPLHPDTITQNDVYSAGETFEILVTARNIGAFTTGTATLSTDTVSDLITFASTTATYVPILPDTVQTTSLIASIPYTIDLNDLETVLISLIVNADEITAPVEPVLGSAEVTVLGTNGLVSAKLAKINEARTIITQLESISRKEGKSFGKKIDKIEKAANKMQEEFIESQVQLPKGNINSLKSAGHQTVKDYQAAVSLERKATKRIDKYTRNGEIALVEVLQSLQGKMEEIKNIDLTIASTLIDRQVECIPKKCKTKGESLTQGFNFLKEFHKQIRDLKKVAKANRPFCSVDADCNDGLSYTTDRCLRNGFCKYKEPGKSGGDDDDDD